MKKPFREKSEKEISSLSPALQALWHAAHGRWDQAHELVQDDPSAECAWVHAHLHRVEGDIGNARYWYHQAGKKPSTIGLSQELEQLIEALSVSRNA